MANLSFKQGDLSNISNTDISNGVVYFSKDDTSGHSAHGYIFYDDETDRMPINGSGYYIAPEKKDSSKKSMFIENNLFNSKTGATIGVGYNNYELWLHRSNNESNSNRGLWSPLILNEGEDEGSWVLRIGKNISNPSIPREPEAEFLYLSSPDYRNQTGVHSNTYTVRPNGQNTYHLGDADCPWLDATITTVYGSLQGNASTATKLQTARTLKIESGSTVSFDGSSNVTIPLEVSTSWANGQTEGPKLIVTVNGVTSTEVSKIPTATAARSGVVDITDQGFSGVKTFNDGLVGNLTGDVTGNASTATKLKTARTLKVGSGDTVSFNGSANVTIPLAISTSWSDGKIAGPKLKVTVNGTPSDETTVPIASTSASGVVTTSSQTFVGDKTFANNNTYFKMTSQDIWGSISPYNKTFPSSATAETANTLPGIILTAHSKSPTTSSDYWKTRNIDRVILSSGDNASFYPTSVNNSGDQVNRISLGCNLRRWQNLYVKAIFTKSDRLLPSVDYGVHLGDSDYHWERVYAKAFIGHDTDLRPTTAGKISLGVSGSRWSNIYSASNVNVESDIRIKEVQDFNILDRLLKMYDSIEPIAYRLKNFNPSDNHDRIHVGFSSQEIEEKMLENNLTRMDFGGLCVDPVYQKDEEGNDTSEIIDERYSLRYGEFHGLHTLKNQQQDARLTELENKNKELENIISTLKTQVELLKLAIGG